MKQVTYLICHHNSKVQSNYTHPPMFNQMLGHKGHVGSDNWDDDPTRQYMRPILLMMYFTRNDAPWRGYTNSQVKVCL